MGAEPLPGLDPLPFAKGEIRRQGRRIAILAFGTLLHPALQATEKLDATVANMRWAKPLDENLLRELASSHEAIVTRTKNRHIVNRALGLHCAQDPGKVLLAVW